MIEWLEEQKLDSAILYQNEAYEFIVTKLQKEGQSGAEITRRCRKDGAGIQPLRKLQAVTAAFAR